MSEEDARSMARDVLKSLGLRRGWHQTYVRFGSNTVLTYDQRSEKGVVLNENDIFFIDIGPIYGDHEGDAGSTFCVGDDAEMQRAAVEVKELWFECRNFWLENSPTGIELQKFAETEAKQRGWIFNLDPGGHRLSDFPHRVHFDGALSEVDFSPTSLLWVLEMQIRHPERPFGAFYEDILASDEQLTQGDSGDQPSPDS